MESLSAVFVDNGESFPGFYIVSDMARSGGILDKSCFRIDGPGRSKDYSGSIICTSSERYSLIQNSTMMGNLVKSCVWNGYQSDE